MMRAVRSRLIGMGWLIGWRLARLLPERWVRRGFERLSLRQFRRNARARAIVRENLRPAVPADRLEQTVRDAFLWYGRYWAETFRMEDLSPSQLDERFAVEGLDHIDRAYKEGRGVVLATPHLGNWDSGGRFVAERWPLTVVVEILRPRMVFDRFVEHRRGLGMTIIPLERGADATAACLQHLQAGEVIALVADRDFSRSGVEVSLFGRTAKMPPGPAVLALRAGAPLIAAAIYQRSDGTWLGRVLPPLRMPSPAAPDAVARLTQRLADAFSELIGAEPAQWHVFNPYWPSP